MAKKSAPEENGSMKRKKKIVKEEEYPIGNGRGRGSGSGYFSELEKDAAEQLIQLSGSLSTSDNNVTGGKEESDVKSGLAAARGGDGDGDRDRDGQVCSSKYRTIFGDDEVEQEEEEDDGELDISLGSRRKMKRCRSMAELYKLTKPLNLVNVVNNRKRRRVAYT
ncbi:hypothetical protein ACFX13_032453 [Malus domestica]|uniref:Uncharacterized protein n=1 Tax=Malus domestica TaxID=3750 RepID=A0A498K2Y8_MALDO|nr:hypothetical protein DVH24_000888 [Malus domestica]